jgi:hypothetical protein
MFSQVDSKGNLFAIMDEIVEHRKNPSLAVAADDQFIVSPNGQKSMRKITKGCSSVSDGRTQAQAG